MDLVFPQNLKPNTLSWPSSSTLFLPWNSIPWRPRTLTPASKLKHVKIRSEFDGKVNGALSNDFDPRFLDRVYFTPSFLFFFFSCSCICVSFPLCNSMFIFIWGSLITEDVDFTRTHFLFLNLDENPFVVFANLSILVEKTLPLTIFLCILSNFLSESIFCWVYFKLCYSKWRLYSIG